MGSETDEITVADSDESILDFKELNDAEFDLPSVSPASLESILLDMDLEDASDSASIQSFQSVSLKFKSMLYHCILQGLSSQIQSATARVGTGFPTVITNSNKYVAIGTSHGYILAFDAEQSLCWCSHDQITTDQGGISSLAFNLDSTRLLVGYERGYISMLDTTSGDIVRRLFDAHAPISAVLQLRFTGREGLVLSGDSAGCVFMLHFGRRLGLRTWDSKCLFSGARGEVCCFEPFLDSNDIVGHNVIVALATLSKIIIISIKPKLRVLYSQPLPRTPTHLPHLSWQLVLIGRTWQPVLAWGRGIELNYTRLVFTGINQNKIRLVPLRSVQLQYSINALHWLGNRHLAILDSSENLRLIEVRTQKELEVLELTAAGVVYSSAHFKALALGGGVSEAFALAGERACYNSLSSLAGQILVLGTRSVHLVKLRTWHERLVYLSDQGRWSEALNLAAEEAANSMGATREKSIDRLLNKFIGVLAKGIVDKESFIAAINCCVKLNKIDLMCNELWDSIVTDQSSQTLFYDVIAEHIVDGRLTYISPAIAQNLVAHLETYDLETLRSVLLSLDLTCLDLHQVLNICKQMKMYDVWIHITTKTIGDYTSPLTEFLNDMQPDNSTLGNTMLVYVSSCLTGLGYPRGNIPTNDILRVKYDVLRCLQSVHSVNAASDEKSYPFLRALLQYNTRECLNVVRLAFTQEEFAGEMGLLHRQRLIEILIQIVTPPEFEDSQITILSCFIARLITSNHLKIDDSTLALVMKSLTKITNKPLSLRDHIEKEQALLDLLTAGKLSNLNWDQLLQMSLECKLYRVAEYVYECRQDYSSIFTCYLNDTIRKSEIFIYILTNIANPYRKISEQFIKHFKELALIDCKKSIDILAEYFPEQLDDLFKTIRNDNLEYNFLNELFLSDLKVPEYIAERYLELLCINQPDSVSEFVEMGLCHPEKALELTKQYNIYGAIAILLEKLGEYAAALELLLAHGMSDNAIDVCTRAADHLDAESSRELWFTLLKHPNSFENVCLRKFLHSAAPHVPPAQLLEFVSDANFGDMKGIVEGMIADCNHDIDILSCTLSALDKDLHQGLAKDLCYHGRGISISKPVCNVCQTPLLVRYQSPASNLTNKSSANTSLLSSNRNTPIKSDLSQCIVWGCGHCFHAKCIETGFTRNSPDTLGIDIDKSSNSTGDSASKIKVCCPYCRYESAQNMDDALHGNSRQINKTKARENDSDPNKIQCVRPDLEGHF